VEGGRAGEAEAKPAGFAARGPPRRANGAIGVPQDCLRIGEEGLTGLGQFDAARFAAKQLYLKFGFQRAKLLRQRRLLNTESLGRPRDMTFLGNCDEITEMA
jgi:hypothetical protein